MSVLFLRAAPVPISLCPGKPLLYKYVSFVHSPQTLALMHSEERKSDWNGEIFYINDGVPRSTLFLIRPLYRGLFGKEYRPLFLLPFWMFLAFSLIINGLSSLLGKKFRLPFWGATYMEALKVKKTIKNINVHSNSHILNIYRPHEVTLVRLRRPKESWDSLQLWTRRSR